MSTRNPEKELMKNLKDFETYVKMADSAIKSAKPKLKKLIEIKNKLETSYFNLNQCFHFYKLDVIAKECKTEVAFNGKEEEDSGEDSGEDSYEDEHNDTWSDSQFAKFIETTEYIDNKIYELEGVEEKSAEIKPTAAEENVGQKLSPRSPL